MDDDGEEEEEGPGIGVRPKHDKSPNPLNEAKRQRKARQKEEQERAQIREQVRRAQNREQEEEDQQDQEEEDHQDQEQQEEVQQGPNQSKIPSFGDGSEILTDWTTSGLIRDPIDQYKDTCGSVVFTHLLEIVYNKDRPIAQRRELSVRDLAEYIKSRTPKNKFSFRNLNIPINYIREIGLHKDGKISGVRTKGNFEHRLDATKEFVLDRLEMGPLGIVVRASAPFEDIGNGISFVPEIQPEDDDDHAMLVVAKGTTKGINGGIDFLVTQNWWGTIFGNSGYCRISLPENGRFKIFWPRW